MLGINYVTLMVIVIQYISRLTSLVQVQDIERRVENVSIWNRVHKQGRFIENSSNDAVDMTLIDYKEIVCVVGLPFFIVYMPSKVNRLK